jgi:hypothetical protein
MRMSKTHKVTVTAVMTTIATATVLTFTRADTAPADRIAALPQASNDAPVVERSTPEATTRPTPTPEATTPSPEASKPATQAPKPVAKPDKPAKPTAKPAAPTTVPTPAPTPTKSLLDILLGQ